jgi:hypothetical protein
MRLEQGTEVRVDIPDRTDPDFERYHRRCGIIVGGTTDRGEAESALQHVEEEIATLNGI